jgi:hypothetical protein
LLPQRCFPNGHFDKLLALAGRENVAVKASALPLFTTNPYPYSNLHSFIGQVYDAFGPSRMFWGSDLSRMKCTYKQAVAFFTEGIPWLTRMIESGLWDEVCASGCARLQQWFNTR